MLARRSALATTPLLCWEPDTPRRTETATTRTVTTHTVTTHTVMTHAGTWTFWFVCHKMAGWCPPTKRARPASTS